ncbi:MAG: Glycerate kinase [Candidatus Nomurabacteria bacterium GW2011_GWF2_43_8]|uniref:Glycerate kinase n=1 Tax=Candidatus Nomurabacteria bacterium GW2011_GWF2_43_8 TaxID=1618779 RepID=A0A0G1HYH3_9BACT|nr:MAG: Glycerate kinase [Candidatus Nomurabacteria bacterium GW2011_GWF2_43_8]
MIGHQIKNYDELATTPNRILALQLIEAGLDAINTGKVVNSSISLNENILSVKGKKFDLAEFEKIKVVGFGKASADAAAALEKILGSRIEKGVVISLQKADCDFIETFAGAHPIPSRVNQEAGEKIYEIVKDSTEKDLVIVLVSLLCYPESECEQGQQLYNSFLKSGKTIAEINTVRKHLSLLKGGGLAQAAYPATVIGLVFSDIPGDNFENVASGPTYRDTTTMADAEKIIRENNLGDFKLMETPKEKKYFKKVHNFVLVSNRTALQAMREKAKNLGLKAKIISTDLYTEVGEAVRKIFSKFKENSVILVGGEPSVSVPQGGGKGGRNLHVGITALQSGLPSENSVFVSFASDGMDNSDAAGALVDKNTKEKADKLGLRADKYMADFDSYTFFQNTGDLIITGSTGANVSDLMILLTKNGK